MMDGSVCVTELAEGRTTRLTPRRDGAEAPLSFACVFSPDGRAVAYLRNVAADDAIFSQIFVITLSWL
jgi:hypothetical protein